MELFFFLLLAIIMLILFAVGLKTGNFGLLILGSVIALSLGGLVLSEGVTTEKIVYYEVDDTNSDAPIVITPQYTTELAADATEIFILGWVLLAGGLVFLIFSIYYSATGADRIEGQG